MDFRWERGWRESRSSSRVQSRGWCWLLNYQSLLKALWEFVYVEGLAETKVCKGTVKTILALERALWCSFDEIGHLWRF